MRSIKSLALIALLLVVVASVIISIVFYLRGNTEAIGKIALVMFLAVAILGPFTLSIGNNQK